jgi:hypothetical protein
MPARSMQYTAVISVLLAGGLSACSGAGSSSPAAATSPTARATPRAAAAPLPSFSGNPAAVADAGAALAAYEAAWADIAAVEDDGNYQDPRLEDHLAGQLLLLTSEDLYVAEQKGITSRGAPILSPHVVAVNAAGNPPTATVDDCIDARHFVQYYAATGKPYGTPATTDLADTATVTLTNGSWMVTANDEEFGTPCTP